MFGKRARAINTGNIITYEWGKRQMAEHINSQGLSGHVERFDCHRWYTGPDSIRQGAKWARRVLPSLQHSFVMQC